MSYAWGKVPLNPGSQRRQAQKHDCDGDPGTDRQILFGRRQSPET
jgi:hypothetical protein